MLLSLKITQTHSNLYRHQSVESVRIEETTGSYGGKDSEKRWVLRRKWKTPWDTWTTSHGSNDDDGELRDVNGTPNTEGRMKTVSQVRCCISKALVRDETKLVDVGQWPWRRIECMTKAARQWYREGNVKKKTGGACMWWK